MLSVAEGGDNRHWLTPARKNLVMEEVERYGEHDRRVRMKVSPQARKRNPNLPTHWEVREVSYESQGQIRSLLTSLPTEGYSAKAVAELYLERWEIELGFRAIKSSMQQNAVTLRSKKVELIYQEVWGLLLAYNIIHREASQACLWSNTVGHTLQTGLSFVRREKERATPEGADTPKGDARSQR
ncbi:hypothetical protein KU43P_12720 [Pseudomonas sp. KU43P]|nr:hypothetical protein KU43P_12720 [Pseudomonas sp. KU43P]